MEPSFGNQNARHCFDWWGYQEELVSWPCEAVQKQPFPHYYSPRHAVLPKTTTLMMKTTNGDSGSTFLIKPSLDVDEIVCFQRKPNQENQTLFRKVLNLSHTLSPLARNQEIQEKFFFKQREWEWDRERKRKCSFLTEWFWILKELLKGVLLQRRERERLVWFQRRNKINKLIWLYTFKAGRLYNLNCKEILTVGSARYSLGADKGGTHWSLNLQSYSIHVSVARGSNMLPFMGFSFAFLNLIGLFLPKKKI